MIRIWLASGLRQAGAIGGKLLTLVHLMRFCSAWTRVAVERPVDMLRDPVSMLSRTNDIEALGIGPIDVRPAVGVSRGK